jgi:alkanesulfonate monooxygenase SsuD/methylene tetrahydromethanopterin reductase-like flavin-dependent oxidoreductase (luciferase family)
MRFSLALYHGEWARGGASAATLALAQRADEGGFDTLWLNEDPDGWDAFALLGAISQRTERIRLAVGVTNPYLRNPNQIAASVATVDRLAPGRTVLGLGRGQPEWYERALGMVVGSPLGRVEETIDLLRQWWSPDGVASIDGELHIDRWTRVIGPLSPPPIYLAAAGPQALDLAGRAADGVYFNLLATPDYLRRAIGRVKQAAIAAGRDPDALQFVANPGIVVTDDPATILAGRKRFAAKVLTLPGMDALLENPEIDVAAIMRRVRILMKTDEILAAGGAFADFDREGDIAAAVAAMPDALVDRGSAVGPMGHVRERIAELVAAGATDLLVARNGLPPDVEGIRSLLRELGR